MADFLYSGSIIVGETQEALEKKLVSRITFCNFFLFVAVTIAFKVNVWLIASFAMRQTFLLWRYWYFICEQLNVFVEIFKLLQLKPSDGLSFTCEMAQSTKWLNGEKPTCVNYKYWTWKSINSVVVVQWLEIWTSFGAVACPIFFQLSTIGPSASP